MAKESTGFLVDGFPATLQQAQLFEKTVGKPSTRNPVLSLDIASANRSITTSSGTRMPFSMVAKICMPLAEFVITSSLSRSPEDKCVYRNLPWIFSHWVPFPDPGPPITQIIGGAMYVTG